MGGRELFVLVLMCVVLVGAMPPNSEIRTKRGIKGGSRTNLETRDSNGCQTFGDGGYECRHSYGYGDKDPFTNGGVLDPNTIATPLNTRDFGRDLVQAHVAGFEGDKNGCKTFPDGSYECRRGYSYSASTHGWDALQHDPLAAGSDLRSVLNLHGVDQDLAALRDGTASFDRNQNGCRTFPDGSWECKRSWGYGSTSESQTASNLGTIGRGSDISQDYSDIRGGTGKIGRDENGCRTFTDGSWECRRGYSYNAATGWNVVSSDIPASVSERRSSYNSQSASQNVQVNRNGGFDTTQKGCRTYADGSWECKPEWGYRSSTDSRTTSNVQNPRERDNIRDADRNVGSRTYTSTQERQEVFSNNGGVAPHVPVVSTSSALRGADQDSRVNPKENPTGCTTLSDGTTECTRGYSYSSRQERNYTSGGVANAPQPSNREAVNRPRDRQEVGSVNSHSYTQERESLRNAGRVNPVVNVGLDTQVREKVAEVYNSRNRLEETPVRSSYSPHVPNEPESPERDHRRPVGTTGNVARHEYSYTQERESVRNGGVDRPAVGSLSAYPRETAPSPYSSTVTTERPSIYSGGVVNSQNRGRVYQEPGLGTSSRTSYSQTQQKEVVNNIVRPHANPNNDRVSTHATEDFGEASNVKVNPSYSRPVTSPQYGDRDHRTPVVDSGVSGTRTYSYTQEKEVVNHGGIVNPNAGRTVGLNTQTGSHSSDIRGSTGNSGLTTGNLNGNGCETNADGSTVCRRGYSHSSTQQREIYSGGSADIIQDHEEPGMVSVISHPNPMANKEGCKTQPDGAVVCERGHSQTRQWGYGVNSGAPIVPSHTDGSLNHQLGSESLLHNQLSEDLTRTATGVSPYGSRSSNPHREVEGVKTGRRTSTYSSSSSQTHRVHGGITNPSQNGGSYSNSDSNYRQSAALQQGSPGNCRTLSDGRQDCRQNYGHGSSSQHSSSRLVDGSYNAHDGSSGNIAEVHSQGYVKSGSSGRGGGSAANGNGCALIAGSPCNRNSQQQSGYSFNSYGSSGFRTGTLEV